MTVQEGRPSSEPGECSATAGRIGARDRGARKASLGTSGQAISDVRGRGSQADRRPIVRCSDAIKQRAGGLFTGACVGGRDSEAAPVWHRGSPSARTVGR